MVMNAGSISTLRRLSGKLAHRKTNPDTALPLRDASFLSGILRTKQYVK